MMDWHGTQLSLPTLHAFLLGSMERSGRLPLKPADCKSWQETVFDPSPHVVTIFGFVDPTKNLRKITRNTDILMQTTVYTYAASMLCLRCIQAKLNSGSNPFLSSNSNQGCLTNNFMRKLDIIHFYLQTATKNNQKHQPAFGSASHGTSAPVNQGSMVLCHGPHGSLANHLRRVVGWCWLAKIYL